MLKKNIPEASERKAFYKEYQINKRILGSSTFLLSLVGLSLVKEGSDWIAWTNAILASITTLIISISSIILLKMNIDMAKMRKKSRELQQRLDDMEQKNCA
jgi:hypothetical protein